MILLINTVVKDRLLLGLAKNDKLIDRWGVEVGCHQAEKLLPMIDKILKKHKVSLKQLKGIVVAAGPGGFTSARLGVLTANTLSYSLKIPTVGIKLDGPAETLEESFLAAAKRLKNKKGFNLVRPYYGSEPNITKPKK